MFDISYFEICTAVYCMISALAVERGWCSVEAISDSEICTVKVQALIYRHVPNRHSDKTGGGSALNMRATSYPSRTGTDDCQRNLLSPIWIGFLFEVDLLIPTTIYKKSGLVKSGHLHFLENPCGDVPNKIVEVWWATQIEKKTLTNIRVLSPPIFI